MAALTLGLAIGGYRIPALVCSPVILAIGTYGLAFRPARVHRRDAAVPGLLGRFPLARGR